MLSRPIMSWINLGEVAYIVERRADADRARHVVRDLRPWLMLDLPNETRVLEASDLRAGYLMTSAEAFAVARAIARGATLVSGDPEILYGDPSWPVGGRRSYTPCTVRARMPRVARSDDSGTTGKIPRCFHSSSMVDQS